MSDMCAQTESHIISRARHISASFNIEKLVHRIHFHLCAKQQQQQQQPIPNTATTSQIYMTTTTHTNNTFDRRILVGI
jgi:hypothetical protein